MKKYNISVYAISKNEEKFAARWAKSMSEADSVIVLDTGSTDNTVKILSAFPNVTVFSEAVSPWRFDTARNISLSKVPEEADYCVCTDLDEVFPEGWREKLENALSLSPDSVSYRYVWAYNEDGSENTVFNIEKIHRRQGFLWTHPVHEVLKFTGDTKKTVFAEGLTLSHYPDSTKSRSSYLPLLELSVKESPEDDRNVHYLGREYMFYRRYSEAIETLKYHLSLKSALWQDERCASMRYIARCFSALEKPSEALLWHLRACAEAPYTREPWMETAEFFYRQQNWHGVITFINKALEITNRTDTYITDSSNWKEKPYDLLSIAYFYTGNREKAIENAQKALTLSPDDERIKNNLMIIQNAK